MQVWKQVATMEEVTNSLILKPVMAIVFDDKPMTHFAIYADPATQPRHLNKSAFSYLSYVNVIRIVLI